MQTIAESAQKPVHRVVYFASLAIIAVSLPLSRFLLTAGELLLIANWLTEGDFRRKFARLRHDRAAIALMLVYALNIIGVLWSHDPMYGVTNDLLHKSPLLFLPLVVATTPAPDRKKSEILVMLFISALFIATLAGLILRQLHGDIFFRDASPFIPGVYMGMMLIIAAFQLPLLTWQTRGNGRHLMLSLLLSAWLIWFLFYLRTLSSVASLAAVSLFTLIVTVRKSRYLVLKTGLPLLFTAALALVTWQLAGIWKEVSAKADTDFSTLPQLTEQGNPYFHDTLNIITENGNLVYISICDTELREAWNAVSSLDFDGNDLMGQELRATLYRYMASMGVRKDARGFSELTDKDIAEIERGRTSRLDVGRPGILIRVREEMMSLSLYYRSGRKDTSWGSLTKRIDLWRASCMAVKRHPWFGWGTGGVMKAMDYGKSITGSTLAGAAMKPHNQYLYILLSSGIAGMAVTILLLTYFIKQKRLHHSYIFWVFLITFLVNFAGNNSFESQPGHDLFIFFLLVYGYFRQ